MRSVVCDKCGGRGVLRVDDPEAPCHAEIVLNHETISCFATRQHPGQPHMAILCEPCIECGGYDEHAPDPFCGSYAAAPSDPALHWWAWRDGDFALSRVPLDEGQKWRRQYQPDAYEFRREGAAA